MKFDAVEPGQGGGFRARGKGGHRAARFVFAFLLFFIIALGQTVPACGINNYPPFFFTDERAQLAAILGEWHLWESDLRYLAYAAVAGLVLILGLALWNLALNRQV